MRCDYEIKLGEREDGTLTLILSRCPLHLSMKLPQTPRPSVHRRGDKNEKSEESQSSNDTIYLFPHVTIFTPIN